LKVYCAGPIRGDTTFQKFYFKIIEIVEKLGHKALTELSSNYRKENDNLNIYQRDIKWLLSSDILIAEVSGPSTGVGYEIAYALHQAKKPVLALYNSNVKKISAMLLHNTSNMLTLKAYSDERDLEKIIKDYIHVLI